MFAEEDALSVEEFKILALTATPSIQRWIDMFACVDDWCVLSIMHPLAQQVVQLR